MEEDFISENISMTRNILYRFRNRDFSGNIGMAIKNSTYLFMTNILMKISSLIFTILLAKWLLDVETFGLYSLAISTILLFLGFSDLGIGQALVRYVSLNNANSKGYIKYLAKLKIYLSLIISILLILSAYFLANFYYQKPIFLALVVGSIYLLTFNLINFISGIYRAENNFKTLFFKEIIFQLVRVVFVPLTLVYLLSISLENICINFLPLLSYCESQIIIASIFIVLSFGYFICFLFLYFKSKTYTGRDLNLGQKIKINLFILPFIATVFSGVFFGHIDMIMLGRFVDSTHLAYYYAAFALLTSASGLISFGTVLLPIFSRLKTKNHLKRGLRKSLLLTSLIAIAGIIATIILAPFLVPIIYNESYLPTIFVLQCFSILILISPLIGIYTSYFTSRGRTFFIAKTLVFVTIINIILNYILIKSFLTLYGQETALIGAVLATIISKSIYLGCFAFARK